MLSCLDPLRELSLVSIFFRFLLSTVCGSAIGFERSRNRHGAGLRTHIVVCIGSASVMVLNQYLLQCFNANADPARLGAQVISGIGFLGAGTIVITGHQQGQRIKGLTTAAGLWASACMGLVLGSGYYEAGIVMCCFLFCVIVALNKLDAKYLKNSTVARLYVEYTVDTPFSSILSVLRDNDWHLSNLEYPGGKNNAVNGAILDVQRSSRNSDKDALMDALRGIDGVTFAEDA